MWEYLAGAIASPAQALREVAEKKLWREGLLLVVVIALIGGAVSVVSLESNLALPSTLQLDPGVVSLFNAFHAPAVFLPLVLVGSVLSWFIIGAIYYGFSKLFKREGTLPGMLASLAFAQTPSLVSTPIVALALLLGPAGTILGNAASLVAGLWILVLDVLAIRESQRLETGQAIGVLLIAFAALFVLCIIVVALVAIMAIATFGAGAK